MGKLRTANKRHKRAILALSVAARTAKGEPAVPGEPAAEAVRS